MPREHDRDLHRSIGANIQQLRHARGWTQEQLAERLEIQPANLSRYETGARGMSLDLFIRTARVLQVDLDVLVAPPDAVDGAEGDVDELQERWRRLDGEGREHVLWLLRKLT